MKQEILKLQISNFESLSAALGWPLNLAKKDEKINKFTGEISQNYIQYSNTKKSNFNYYNDQNISNNVSILSISAPSTSHKNTKSE